MLKRSKRIQGKPIVQALLKDGDSFSHPFFVLIKRANGLDRTRYCVIVSKKLERSAVKRNKRRRQINEIIRLLEKESLVPSSVPFDIVLIARRPVAKASYDDLSKNLRTLLTSLA